MVGKGKSLKAFKVPRCALEIYRFADKGTMKNLQCVHFEQDPTPKLGKGNWQSKINAVATDGHRLIHLSWDSETPLPETVDVPASVLKEYMQSFGRKPLGKIAKDYDFSMSKVKGDWMLSGASPSPFSLVVKSTSEERVFPDWRQVIPDASASTDAHSITFGIDLKYLNDFCKFLESSGSGSAVIVTYADSNSLGPITFNPTIVGDEIGNTVSCTYIVMPMRM